MSVPVAGEDLIVGRDARDICQESVGAIKQFASQADTPQLHAQKPAGNTLAEACKLALYRRLVGLIQQQRPRTLVST